MGKGFGCYGVEEAVMLVETKVAVLAFVAPVS